MCRRCSKGWANERSLADVLAVPALARADRARGCGALVLALLNIATRLRGALVRAAALALFVLALANPSFSREDRDDPAERGGRRRRPVGLAGAWPTERRRPRPVRTALAERLKSAEGQRDPLCRGRRANGTRQRRHGAVRRALQRAGGCAAGARRRRHPDHRRRRARYSGQGRRARLLRHRSTLSSPADPTSATGASALTEAPRFGIVGKPQTMRFKVIDQGPDMPATATVVIRRDGQEIDRRTVPAGQITAARSRSAMADRTSSRSRPWPCLAN